MHHSAISSVGLLACAAFLIASPVNAGEFGEPIPDAAPGKSSLIDPITGVVSLGYDSTYMFRGSNLGKNAPWGGIDLTAPLGRFAIDAGAWYTNPASPDGGAPTNNNDELDLYVSGTTTAGIFDLWIGYTAYLYPESGRDSTNEVGLGWRVSLNFIDVGFGYYHDFGNDTNYYEYFASKNIDLNEFISLNMGLTLGHFGTRNFHGVLSTGLNFALTDNLTLTTYIAYNFVDVNRAATGFEDRFFGGASVSVAF